MRRALGSALGSGVVGKRSSRRRVDAEERPVQAGGVAGGAQVLAAQRAALGGGWGENSADATRRVAAGVERAAVLAVVDEVEAGSVAAAHVQGAVGAEVERADRVARILLAPVLDQHLLGPGHRVARGSEARDPPADDAPVVGRTRRAGTAVEGGARGPPARCGATDCGVVGVEHIDVGVRREVRVERQPQQPAVPEVVHLRPQVREDVRLHVRQRVEDLDETALLGDEDASVG